MPVRKICYYPSCQELIDTDQRYCPLHRTESERKPFSKAVRYNTALYATSKWRNLRKAILRENPRCERCGIGEGEASLHVHHIIPPRGNEELFHDETNLGVLCAGCHRAETARETRGRRDR